MGSSILSLAFGGRDKAVKIPTERAPFRTVESRSDATAGDVNILRIAAEHAPVRIAAIDSEIRILEERLANLREEKLYVTRLQKVTDAYYAARQERSRPTVPKLVVNG